MTDFLINLTEAAKRWLLLWIIISPIFGPLIAYMIGKFLWEVPIDWIREKWQWRRLADTEVRPDDL